MARSKSKSAPGLLSVFSSKEQKKERKKELSRKLFADLSEYVNDFETNQKTREKVKEIITTYHEEILRASSTKAEYVLNLKDIEPAADTLINEYADHPLIDIICGMILYGEIRNSKITQGAFLRADDSVAKQWIKGRFMTNKDEDIVPKMGTIFRVAFCDMKVLKSLESFLGENIRPGLESTIRGAILVEPDPLSTPIVELATCTELAANACNIIEETKKIFANEVVDPTADAAVADAAVVKPKKRATVSDMFAAVVKAFTEWLFEAKQPEKSVMASVAGSPETIKKSVRPEAELRHNDAKSKQPPLMKVEQPIRRNYNALSNSKYNFYEECSRNNTKKEKEWETPQPLCLLTDEHGSPLMSRLG